ncbi:hypothetical protein CRUP_006504, partial [Coryphaenoides rupestris]
MWCHESARSALYSSRVPLKSLQQQPGNAVSRLWGLAQRAVRQTAPQTSKPRGVALKFILGPAFFTISARLVGHVAYCEADVNNNVHAEVATKEPVQPEFDWHILWEFVKPQLFALLGAVVLAFGAALLNIQIPLMLGQLVNIVARYMREHTGNYVHEIRGPAFKLLGLYGIQGLLTTGYIILLSRVGERVAADMRKTLFASLLRQDVAFFDANKTGQLVNRLTADIQEFKSSFKLVISQGLRSLTQTVGCFVSLYIISPKLTGLTVVVLPCLVGAGALIGSFLRKLSRLAQEQVSKATGVADEALGNVRTVKAFAMEERELQSLASISILFGQVVRGLSSGARVFEYMTLEPSIQASRGGRIPYHSLSGRIDFLNISFSYPTRPGHQILKGFSLTLPPAKTVAIVGESGGVVSVMLDGLDIQTLDLSWLRGQEPVLFGSSVMENIRFGKPGATDAEVIDAAKQANAHRFISSFPDGYSTVVEAAQSPSPARSIKDPRVPGAGIGHQRAGRRVGAGGARGSGQGHERAHGPDHRPRLSTIQGADLICVMSNGRIVE